MFEISIAMIIIIKHSFFDLDLSTELHNSYLNLMYPEKIIINKNGM